MSIMVDTVVAGRYRVLGLLGAGADSEVFRAADLQAADLHADLQVPDLQPDQGRLVALKTLSRPSDDATVRRRFEEEVRILASLDHPNLVPLSDHGVFDGRPFFVMPLVAGASLEDLFGSGPIPPGEVRHIGAGVADALDYVHARGVVHRDIKPQNILLGPRRHVFLTDFGVAKSWDGPLLTAPGHVVGTAGYVSPEQAEGQEATDASDIYSLGLVLLEALTGHREYTGTAAERAAVAAARSPRIPPALGAPWCRVLARMTARDPQSRPKIDEVRALLAAEGPDSGGLVRRSSGNRWQWPV